MFKKIQEAKGEMRKTWDVLNFFMERKTRIPNDVTLAKNFKTTDQKTLANKFNKTFKDQIIKLKQENDGPRFQINMKPHELQNRLTSFHLKMPTREDIYVLRHNQET
jgi:hypothetical protein